MADGSSKQELATRSQVVDWLIETASNSIEGPGGELVFWAKIDPAVAGAILRVLNTNNPRNEMHSVARRYIQDMTDNKWWASYSPLVFEGENFDFIDGQHRLRGVVQSRTVQSFLVVIYAAAEAKRGIDMGKQRSIAITHGLHPKAAAGCRLIYQLESGDARVATREQVASVAERYQSVCAEVVLHARRRKPTSQASFIAAFMIAIKHGDNEGLVRELLEDISSLSQASDAAKAIMQVLERDGAPSGSAERCDQTLKILLGITGHLEGRSRQILRPSVQGLRWFLPQSKYRLSGPSPEIGGRRRELLSELA